jgi:hypothetical protein
VNVLLVEMMWVDVGLLDVMRFFSGFGVGFWRFFTKTTLKIYLYRLQFC